MAGLRPLLNSTALTTILGTSIGADNFGTFTGSTIPNNASAKEALQALETFAEGINTDASAAIAAAEAAASDAETAAGSANDAAAAAQNVVDSISGPGGAAIVGTSDGSNVENSLSHGGFYSASGVGGTTRQTSARLLERALSAVDYGASNGGVTSALTSLINTSVAARVPFTDGPGRTFSKIVQLPPGKFLIDDILQLAPTSGTVGLIVQGAGNGSTEVDYSGSSATIKSQSSRNITFKDITFKSSGVDDNQVAFTISPSGNSLRSWTFINCDFIAFYKCFDVTGNSMCSEFQFYGCAFLQCYRLMNNSNSQAVNWNFYGCNWENDSLVTTKDKTQAALVFMTAGTKLNWLGGSMIFWGRLALFNLTVAGQFQRVAHSVHFKGSRIELIDEGGTHVPIIDRIDTGWVNGTNQPVVTLEAIDLIKRGTIGIGNDIAIARIWDNCTLTIRDCNFQICHVTGVLDATTPSSTANLLIENSSIISYVEDTTSRALSHHQHNVDINPANSSTGTAIKRSTRMCDLGSLSTSNYTAPSYATVSKKLWYVRGNTGSLPTGGQNVYLPVFPDHTMFLKLIVQRFQNATNSLTVTLRDQADTTTYATATLAAGTDRLAEANIGQEMGYQIPSGTALMLKLTGTADANIKGLLAIEYI